MAQPTVIAGTKLLILIGNGADPEVFAAPCGLTTRSFDLSASTNSTAIPDCDDPEAAVWEAKGVDLLLASISGAGVLATESFALWNDWFMSGEAKNIQIKLDHDDLGHYAGAFIITGLKLGGERGTKANIDVTMVNDGALVWVDAA